MSSIQRSISSNFFSNFNEHRWLTQIRQTLEEDQLKDDDDALVVSIFNVPKNLMAISPDSYIPQQVAIGPYHYWRTELYEMEKYKLSAAKRTQKNFLNGQKLQDVVQQLIKHEPRIRAHYHKYLNFNGETLAWIMAIDASFLLEFLNLYAVKEGANKVKTLRRVLSSRMSHLFDHGRQKSAHNTILRDIIMLENQIPLFVLRKMLEFQFSTPEEADDVLASMVLGFCGELSPLKMMEDTVPKISVSDCSHLLDFFYKIVTPHIEVARHEEALEIVEEYCTQGREDRGNKWKQLLCLVLKVCGAIWRLLKKIIKPRDWFLKLPCNVLSNFPLLRILLKPVLMILSQEREEIKPEDNQSIKPPLIEEIVIPSVSELSKSGVVFCPTNGNLSTMAFDPKTVTFYLPTISLDANTEAILRNLVAYEASNASGPLIFTRYTELMNGIIDTEEDVKLLREKGIILNRLKSDEEAAELWNGMSKSIRLTKVPFLDKAIEDANKYHDGKWKVKFGKFMKRYVFGSWQFLVFLAAVWILLLMGFQAFCSVFACRRFFSSTHR